MTIFSKLPQDILQWEIGRFLTSTDVLNFNTVLKKDERVYKKFPKDYALKHAIITKKIHYEAIATRLNKLLDCLTLGPRIVRAQKDLKKLFTFFLDPSTAIIFTHQLPVKFQMAHMIEQWMEEDQELYYYMTYKETLEMIALARKTRDYINSIPNGRDVTIFDHTSVY
jgi:hypothetical protein